MTKPKPTTREKRLQSGAETITRATLPKLLLQAASGKLDWLHRLLAKAGYRPLGGSWTCREIARLYGVSEQAVGQWATRDGCPRTDDRRFSLPDVIQWREGRARADGQGVSAEGASSKTPRGRVNDVQAKILELRYQKELGALIPRDDVERRETLICKTVKAGMENLPREVAPRLVGRSEAEIQELMREAIDRVLREMSE